MASSASFLQSYGACPSKLNHPSPIERHVAPFAHLPTEMILEIIQYLDTRDRKSLAHVSHQLRHVAGPFVYKSQRAADVDRLVRIKVLADQPDVARMILHLDIDAAAMDYWWLGTTQLLESILPNLLNLEILSLRTAHVISSRLSHAIANLPFLHTLKLQLKDIGLGPHISRVKRLRHLELELGQSPPDAVFSSPVNTTLLQNVVSLVQGSSETLETLSLRSSDPICTATIASFAAISQPLRNALQSSEHLTSISTKLEVQGASDALDALDALAGLPITHLYIKCKPFMFPTAPSEGYGLGLGVLKRICEIFPGLIDLSLEDGEVGKRDLARPADGSVFESHVGYLKKLRHLQTVDIPVLLDDLLVHVPSEPIDFLSNTSDSTPPAFPTHPLSRPRRDFEANVNDIMTRTTQGLFINTPITTANPLPNPPPTTSMTSTSDPVFLLHETESYPKQTPKVISSYFARNTIDSDNILQPLPYLHNLRFRIHPTPRLARDLRSVRVYVPAVNWVREVIRDEKHRVAALAEVAQVA